MLIDIAFVIGGLALIVFGADWLVDGASAIARKAGISEFVIGLTIVGFGTSCPELVVSLTGALQGNGAISAGNVLGSNIFNTLLILGLTAVVSPIAVSRSNRRVDIPMTLAVTLIFIVMALTGTAVSRLEGIALLLLFALYMFYCFKTDSGSEEQGSDKPRSLFMAIVLVAAGLAGLIFGGDFFVDHAVAIAHTLGVSDKFIAITLLAGGTSLPELATCVVAAAKHKQELALGNILGSNVFNILLIIGCSAVVAPVNCSAMSLIDFAALAASALLVLGCTFTGDRQKLDRWEGCVLIAGFVAYYVWLFVKL